MSREDLRRWVEGHRAAQRREQEEAATAGDLIVYKAVAWRDRDRSDIERLLTRHRGLIDLDRVRSVVHEFALALDDPGRIAQLEALITRALGADRDA